MSSFENISIDRAANVYFDGRVTSRTIRFANGEVKTLGIMLPGEYRFNTDDKELMEIQGGDVLVRLSDSDEWVAYASGEEFEVPARSAFDIKVNCVTDYCCSFTKE
ncbi:MAG: pyrimidine/purine nucleoside phosphorylase [Gammaproteobacteria bacterium]|nr:pyrimidine/purine nucleoside phosphorylase [Gammaproteobacteria bacterium]